MCLTQSNKHYKQSSKQKYIKLCHGVRFSYDILCFTYAWFKHRMRQFPSKSVSHSNIHNSYDWPCDGLATYGGYLSSGIMLFVTTTSMHGMQQLSDTGLMPTSLLCTMWYDMIIPNPNASASKSTFLLLIPELFTVVCIFAWVTSLNESVQVIL